VTSDVDVSMTQKNVAACCSVLQYVADVDVSVTQKHVVARCSVLQCVALCCSVLQYVADIDVSVTQKEDFNVSVRPLFFGCGLFAKKVSLTTWRPYDVVDETSFTQKHNS